MKKIIRIYIAIIASVCLFMSLPADIYAVVIDVSSYNGFIQWDNMKNYIEGTIIRIGYGNDIQSQDDAAAIRNMDECERLGIPYGVYLYSYALDYGVYLLSDHEVHLHTFSILCKLKCSSFLP